MVVIWFRLPRAATPKFSLNSDACQFRSFSGIECLQNRKLRILFYPQITNQRFSLIHYLVTHFSLWLNPHRRFSLEILRSKFSRFLENQLLSPFLNKQLISKGQIWKLKIAIEFKFWTSWWNFCHFRIHKVGNI